MAVNAVLESIDDLPEDVQSHYTKKKIKDKEVYVLDIVGVNTHPEVVNLKTSFERQKQENATLRTDKAALETKVGELPEDFSIDEWHRLQTLDVDPNDPEAAKKRKEKEDERLAQAKKGYETQIANLKKEIEDGKKKYDADVGNERNLRAGDRADTLLSTALNKVGVQPGLLTGAKGLLRGQMSHEVDADGKLRVFFNTDLGEQEVDTYVDNWSKSDDGKPYITPASGGDAGGGRPRQVDTSVNPFSHNAWSKTQQAALARDDRPRAERMAKSAGFATLEVAIKASRAINGNKGS